MAAPRSLRDRVVNSEEVVDSHTALRRELGLHRPPRRDESRRRRLQLRQREAALTPRAQARNRGVLSGDSAPGLS